MIYSVYGMIYTIYGMIYSVYGMIYSVYGMSYSIYGMIYSIYGMIYSIYGMIRELISCFIFLSFFYHFIIISKSKGFETGNFTIMNALGQYACISQYMLRFFIQC